mgnify:FL=1
MHKTPSPEEIRARLTLFQRQLDILRQMLGLATLREKIEWDIKARQIALEYHLDQSAFIATIRCESGFNPRAINKNPNGSTDFGIAQFNNLWYGDIIGPDDALNNPEKALRVMAQKWQEGKAADWVCYSTGKYRQFL